MKDRCVFENARFDIVKDERKLSEEQAKWLMSCESPSGCSPSLRILPATHCVCLMHVLGHVLTVTVLCV